MPPNIQGLNLVQPHQASNDSQDLLSGQAFPDISAQLDLWTNLTFETDEGAHPRSNDDKQQQSSVEEEDDDHRSPTTASGEKAVHDGHVNVVTATNLGTNTPNNLLQPASQSPALSQLPLFDINSFLSGFGIDPFSTLPQQHSPGVTAPSLAQLLALHSHAPAFSAPPPGPFAHYPAQSTAAYPQLAPTTPAPLAPGPGPAHVTTTIAAEEPPAKRPRVHKTPVSTPTSPEGSSPDPPQIMTVAAAEDKRRRNTAASARFRLKKKEREAALEGKAKELESRVNELERECEGLRRENGWLKGLVVGVTGAAQGPVVTAPPPNLSANQLASLTNPSSGMKKGSDH